MEEPLAPDALSALLARSAGRDQAAFAELYRRTSAKLFAVALRIVRRKDWAEDVLQESFVNIWHHAGDYTASRSAPMTWMTSIVRNRCLDWIRRPREETPETFEGMLEGTADDEPGPLAQLAARERCGPPRALSRNAGSQPAPEHHAGLLPRAVA